MPPTLEQIVNAAWAEWDRARDHPEDGAYVPPASAPILWFGNRENYTRAEIKVLTLAVNPGPQAFPQNDPIHGPWQQCRSLRPGNPDRRTPQAMELSCDQYVLDNWFRRWNHVADPCAPLNARLHVDISPLMTNPIFSQVPIQSRKRFVEFGAPILGNLVQLLKPRVVIASLSRTNFNVFSPAMGLDGHIDERNGHPTVKRYALQTEGWTSALFWIRKTGRPPVSGPAQAQQAIGQWIRDELKAHP